MPTSSVTIMAAITAWCLAAAAVALADEPALTMTTYTYKTVSDLNIEADVYRADDDVVRPVVVWIHGGALVVGGRQGVPKNLLDLCTRQGYALVSIDYRLAPEVKLPAIIEDLQDAFRWLRTAGAEQAHLDPGKVVVTGGSAGGYLTMMAGCMVEPRPTALVAYWGYGDVDAPWYSEPSAFYRENVPLIDKQDAYEVIGKQVLSGTGGDAAVQKARGRYYHYLRQNGLWIQEVTGFEPGAPELARYCPLRNIADDYPEIMMVHGTEDTDVPYDQSALMAKELARQGRPHELVTVPVAGHGLSGGEAKLVEQAHQQALDFIRRHLGDGRGN